MKFIKSLGVLLIITLYSITLHAGEYQRQDVTIVRLHPIADNRPAAPAYQNITRVYLTHGAWGNSTCRQDAADLLKTDTHLLSLLITGWTTNKKINIVVDDALRLGDSVCQITALYLE